jgi:predicted DNA-binding transcriptional regulator AlpA
MSGRLLTARELAQRLSVSAGALLRWTRAGQVPGAVKLPSGAIRYRPELIEPWLDELALDKADGADREAPATRDAAHRCVLSSVASYDDQTTEEDRDGRT